MRIGKFGILAASCALVAGAVRAGDSPASGRPFPITASLGTLKPGVRCRIELKPVSRDGRETVKAYEGVVTQANEKGVGLALTRGKQILVRRTPIGRAPVLDRIFEGVGAERPSREAMTEVWLSSRSIGSIHLLVGGAPAKRHLSPMAKGVRSRLDR
jgi:hypothetical protein